MRGTFRTIRDADRFVELFLSSYDKLSADMRHRFPLEQVYVVAG